MSAIIYLPASGPMTATEHEGPVGYETIRSAVGGYIEALTLADGLTLWCNEEGKLQRLPVNRQASALIRLFGVDDLIVGDALLTAGADDDGETLPLPDEHADSLTRFLRMTAAG